MLNLLSLGAVWFDLEISLWGAACCHRQIFCDRYSLKLVFYILHKQASRLFDKVQFRILTDFMS